MTDFNPNDADRQVTGDNRRYTIWLTLGCLAVGVIIATPVGLLLYGFNQPLAVQNGQVAWSFGAFAFPLALIVSGIILAASVFFLPVRLARRAGRRLDPTIWPVWGVYALTAILVAAFVLAILVGLI